jgi:hypothetical protein
MESVLLDEKTMALTRPGEVITLTVVLAIMAIALLAIIAYKVFKSQGGGTVKLPGGWAFEWK